MNAADFKTYDDQFTPVFVGGAARSGTTVLQALLCTSEKANDFIGECSYFNALLHPMALGLDTFDVHTRYYFDSRDAFLAHCAMLLNYELSRVWLRLAQPELLVLKHPIMTRQFSTLASLLKRAKFVVTVRDPLDTIASRVQVMRRQNNGASPPMDEIKSLCDEYNAVYRNITDNQEVFGDRLCIVPYRDIAQGTCLNRLEEFGFGTLHPEKMWEKDDFWKNERDPWVTPLHGGGLSGASIDRWRQELPSEVTAMILDHCKAVMQKLGIPLPELEEASIPAG